MRWGAKTLAAAQFLTSGAAPCLHLPRPPYHLHPCPAPASDNRRVLPTLSPHLRCSSCREVGGREKQAAGTLKFLISSSTKVRENLRSRTGVLQGPAGTRGHAAPQGPSSPRAGLPHHQAPPFLHGGNASSKVQIQGVGFAWLQSGAGVSSTHLGSSASSKVGSILFGSSLAPSQWLWGCSSPPASGPLAARGVRVPRAGTAGRRRASFQFNQSLQSFPPSPAAAGTHWRGPTPSRPTECFGHQVIDPGCREGSCHPVPARLRVPKARGTCAGVTLLRPGIARTWAGGAMEGPGRVLVPSAAVSGWEVVPRAVGSRSAPALLCRPWEDFGRLSCSEPGAEHGTEQLPRH